MSEGTSIGNLVKQVETLRVVVILLVILVAALYIILWPSTATTLFILGLVCCLYLGCRQLDKMGKKTSVQV